MNAKFRRECQRLAMDAIGQDEADATFLEMICQDGFADLASDAWQIIAVSEDQA